MRRATSWTPEGVTSNAGLRSLAELVLDQLNELGLRLGTQLVPQPAGPLPAAMDATSTQAPAAPGTKRGHRIGHRTRTEPRPDRTVEPGGPDAEISDEHAETWRLVTAAQAGDGEAFGQLYDRYVDTVFRFIYFRVND